MLSRSGLPHASSPAATPLTAGRVFSQAAARMWIKEMGHPVKGKSLHRVQVWFLHRMQGRKRSPPQSPWQGGCPEIIPKLRALPWWSAAELEWLPNLQAGLSDVVEELLQLRGQGVFQPYRAPSWAGGEVAADGVGKVSTDRGKWNIFYLQLHEAAEFTDENSKRCPKTVELLRSTIPKCVQQPSSKAAGSSPPTAAAAAADTDQLPCTAAAAAADAAAATRVVTIRTPHRKLHTQHH